MSSVPSDNGTYQLITPPNVLKERVGAGIGIDATLVERADAAVENMQDKFLHRVAAAIDEITEQIALIEASEDDGEDRESEQDSGDREPEIHRISQELQMQGAAFGYPMISDVFGSLCGYIDNLKQPEDLAAIIVEAHTDAIRSVIGNTINGDGGSVGQDMVASLNELVYKALR